MFTAMRLYTNYMKPSILAIRAIGAELANRIYVIVAMIILVLSVLLLGASIWLTTFSSWWWLLVGVLIIAASVAIGVLTILKLIIRTVTPFQSKTQKKQTKAFVNKLEQLSEVAQTSKFVILFRIVRDIAAPRQDGFVASLSQDTTSLRSDFVELSKTFK